MNISIFGCFPNSKYSGSNKLNIEVKKNLSQYLTNLVEKNKGECFHFLCRCDNEFNKMTCMVILGLEEHFSDVKITLEITLPFMIKNKDLDENEKLRYDNYLYLADKVTAVDTLKEYKIPYTIEGIYSEKKIHNCNKYLVDNSDLVIFYSSDFYKSVSDAYTYTRKLGKRYTNIYKGVNYGYRNYKYRNV